MSSALPCPICGNTQSYTRDSRTLNQSTVKRRRECTQCSNRYTTFETIEGTLPPAAHTVLYYLRRDMRKFSKIIDHLLAKEFDNEAEKSD